MPQSVNRQEQQQFGIARATQPKFFKPTIIVNNVSTATASVLSHQHSSPHTMPSLQPVSSAWGFGGFVAGVSGYAAVGNNNILPHGPLTDEVASPCSVTLSESMAAITLHDFNELSDCQ